MLSHVEKHLALEKSFKARFWFALILSIPIAIFSPTIQNWLGFSFQIGSLNNYLSLALLSGVILYAARPFFEGAVEELKSHNYGLMSLASLSIASGYLFSAANVLLFNSGVDLKTQQVDFTWVISTLITVLLLGQWLETAAVRSAGSALQNLKKLIPAKTHKLKGEGATDVSDVNTDEVAVGDRISIKPGETVPLDGVVLDGSSSVNEGSITGQFLPVLKKAGDEVIGGTVNNDGELTIEVRRVGRKTVISQLADLVSQTQAASPQIQKLVDRTASVLTIVAIDGGLLAFYFWGLIGNQGFSFALVLAITVVITACPHALGLAIPTVTYITTALAARNGILIKNLATLEKARSLNYIIFGKTGTLTEGTFGVREVYPFSGTREEVLRLAASADSPSTHPIAKALAREAQKRGLVLDKSENFQATPGQGVSALVAGKQIRVGNQSFFKNITLPDYYAGGNTLVWVAVNGKAIGVVALADAVRADAKFAVEDLRRHGLRVALLTGDNRSIAEAVAGELGIDLVFSEVAPDQKVEKIREIQKEGKTVAMVGDGVNDAPSLTQADIGIAIGAGTDLAIESADIVLMRSSVRDVVKIFNLSRQTAAKMIQNLVWGVGYNIFAIPVAAGALYPWGILLRPEWGAILTTAGALVVVLNALTLLRKKL